MKTKNQRDAILKAAIYMHRLGVAPHWCHKRGKNPVGKNWQKGPRKSLGSLKEEYVPGYNLGLRLGKVSAIEGGYLYVIDADVKSKEPRHRKEMEEALEKLVDVEAPTVLSGRGNGSRHIYLRSHELVKGFKYARSNDLVSVDTKDGKVDRAAWEIEILGENRQVILPPSVHPDTNQNYRWMKSELTNEIPFFKFPSNGKVIHTEPLQAENYSFKVTPFDLESSNLPIKIIKKIKDCEDVANRSDELLGICTVMLKHGVSEDEILTVLTDPENELSQAALERGRGNRKKAAEWLEKYTLPKARDSAILSRFENPREDVQLDYSGDDWENKKPLPLQRKTSPSKEYPVEALGEYLAPAVKRLNEVIQAPLALCAQSVLAAATLVTQGFCDVSIDGRTHPISENFITLGNSGERKSAVDKQVLSSIREHQRDLLEKYKEEFETYRFEKEVYDSKRKGILDRSKSEEHDAFPVALDDLGTIPEAPAKPVLIIEDPTYEGLVKQLEHGLPSIGLFSDEGGKLLGGHAMNKDNQLKTIAGLCGLWDGKPIDRVRGGDGVTIIYGKRISMHLMIQPVVGLPLLSDVTLNEQGWLSRSLMVYPESTMGTRSYLEIDLTKDREMIKLHNTFRKLLKKPLPIRKDTKNELEPTGLGLTKKAKELWKKFYNRTEKKLIPTGEFREISAFANKTSEHALRIASVLTLIGDPGAKDIKSKEMLQAITLLEFYLSEALRIKSCSHGTPELRLAQKLLDWLINRGESLIPLKEIYQKGPGELRDAKSARQIMKILEMHLWVRRSQNRTKELWEVRI